MWADLTWAEDLQAALEGPFGRWRVFPHPARYRARRRREMKMASVPWRCGQNWA